MNKLPRSWVAVEGGNKGLSASYQPLPGIKVLQWNVLADGLAQNGDFVNVPSSVLEWERRWPLILTEIQEADADLICLQEVNKYEDFFLPAMKEAGYGSFYLPKQNSPALKYGAPSDGCAIFYRASKFELRNEPIGKSYVSKDGIIMNQGFIILSLIDKSENRDFILATTHLKAKNETESEEARNLQVSQLLQELTAFRTGLDQDAEVPIIVCGDFNAEPDSQSCRLMRRNSDFRFLSIWDFKVQTAEEQSLITTYKWRRYGLAKRIIDYVWFTSHGDLDLVRRWSMLSDSQIGEQGLPTDGYGSDHIALCAQFAWNKT